MNDNPSFKDKNSKKKNNHKRSNSKQDQEAEQFNETENSISNGNHQDEKSISLSPFSNSKNNNQKKLKKEEDDDQGLRPNKENDQMMNDKDDDDEEGELNDKLNSLKKISDGLEGIGEFEDAWEDEFEEEDSINLNEDNDEDEGSDEDNDNIPGDGKMDEDELDKDNHSRSPSPKTYLPHQIAGVRTLGEDEELVADPTAYKMLHNLSLAWPALSFDVLRDDLGEERRRMPHSACIVAGTQAEASGDVDQDEIMIMKWEGLSKMAKDPDEEDEDEDEDEDDDDDDDGVDEDPTLTYKTIPHRDSVNRVKAQILPMPLSTRPPRPPDHYFIASFSGAGKVHIFDIAPHLFALQSPLLVDDQTVLSKKPFHTINQHGRAEGFALAWGPPSPSSASGSSPSSLRLLSGDICSKIYLTVSDQSGFTTQSKPFASHTSSVEDIQWSPTEPTVFASCSADQSLKIWDVRVKDRRSVLGVQNAHPTDVNVLSWNLKTSYLLVSGGDEGGIKVWDLRNLQSNNKKTKAGSKKDQEPVAMFNWHKSPITSIEWHPTEDSCFISSSADDQLTIWDLSVEIDEEERSKKLKTNNGGEEEDLLIDQKIPPQLLFVHHGQSQIKEVHWHPQIPGTIISTALDGLNVFKTISV